MGVHMEVRFGEASWEEGGDQETQWQIGGTWPGPLFYCNRSGPLIEGWEHI